MINQSVYKSLRYFIVNFTCFRPNQNHKQSTHTHKTKHYLRLVDNPAAATYLSIASRQHVYLTHLHHGRSELPLPGDPTAGGRVLLHQARCRRVGGEGLVGGEEASVLQEVGVVGGVQGVGAAGIHEGDEAGVVAALRTLLLQLRRVRRVQTRVVPVRGVEVEEPAAEGGAVRAADGVRTCMLASVTASDTSKSKHGPST